MPPVRANPRVYALVLIAAAAAGLAVVSANAQAVRPEVVASGLQNPWAVAFLPEGRFLVTERPGRMRVVEANGTLGAPLANVPAVVARGQGGLLDVVTDSDFARNRTVYFCYSEPAASGSGNSTAMARAQLSVDRTKLEDVKVIFVQKPKFDSQAHFGCRIAETKDGKLMLSLGDRYKRMDDAQTLDNHHGKTVRINKDGTVPPDNPFAGKAGALPEIWSIGHRNSQGATIAPDGSYWTVEHGPQGGDEINLPQPGKNYGWPVITYGEQYGGGPIKGGIKAQDGLEQPLHYWVPSIAPSGMVFLTSDKYGAAMKGNLFVGSLKFGYLDRIELEQPFKGKVVRESKLLADRGERIRDVRQGPDGLLYVLTDASPGQLLRLQPR